MKNLAQIIYERVIDALTGDDGYFNDEQARENFCEATGLSDEQAEIVEQSLYAPNIDHDPTE